MIVVEIGCGSDAGPFYEGADQHFIVDNDREALAKAARRDERFTPLVGGDASRLELEDASVDVILARNVFGDPFLGFSESTRSMAAHLPLALLSDGNEVAAAEVMDATTAKVYRLKKDIVQEAARLLVTGGSLLAVEQYTPYIANKFFTDLIWDRDHTTELSFCRDAISAITPPSYAAKHSGSSTDTVFVGTKLG